jgi:hypothetical protein
MAEPDQELLTRKRDLLSALLRSLPYLSFDWWRVSAMLERLR